MKDENIINIGEYVRTEKGKIFQYAKGRAYIGKNNKIIKHSKNIIDLIEVGDFVNNCKVLEKIGKFVQVSTSDYGNSRFFDWQIKTILTHEQYENNCYKVVD